MLPKVLTDYPQMPPLTQEEIGELLCQPLIARLGTLNEDGTIHLAPVIFKYEHGEFLVGTQTANRRVRNSKQNSAVSLLIDDPRPPFKAVLVYGRAELDYEDVLEKRTAIFEKNKKSQKGEKSAVNRRCALVDARVSRAYNGPGALERFKG